MQVSGNYNDHQCRLETVDDAALWTTADIGYGKTPIAVLALSDWIYIYCLRSSKAACQGILLLDITSLRDLSSPTLHRKEFHHGL